MEGRKILVTNWQQLQCLPSIDGSQVVVAPGEVFIVFQLKWSKFLISGRTGDYVDGRLSFAEFTFGHGHLGGLLNLIVVSRLQALLDFRTSRTSRLLNF